MATLTRVLNHIAEVSTSKVTRWITSKDRSLANDRWNGIWDDETKMQAALAAVEWSSGSIVPTAADVIAAKSVWETWVAEQVAAAPARELESVLRTDLKMKAEVALRARDEDKTIDEVIAETVAKV